MIYKASLDRQAIIITTVITIFFLVLIVGQYIIFQDSGKAIPFFTGLVCVSTYGIAYAFKPEGYKVTSDEIIIIRPFVNAYIKRSEILSMEAIGEDRLAHAFRTFGVGGLFGYFGDFSNSSIGSMTWHATRKDKAILIRTSKKQNIILTPDNREIFLKEFMV